MNDDTEAIFVRFYNFHLISFFCFCFGDIIIELLLSGLSFCKCHNNLEDEKKIHM